jgi:predicted small secreted protein
MSNPCPEWTSPRRLPFDAVPLLLLSLFVLAACETVEGFGRDVQSGGEAIEEASEDASRRAGSHGDFSEPASFRLKQTGASHTKAPVRSRSSTG